LGSGFDENFEAAGASRCVKVSEARQSLKATRSSRSQQKCDEISGLQAGVSSSEDEFTEEIACFQGGGDLVREAQALGVQARHLEVFSPLDWALKARPRVRELLRERQPDLVHLYGLRVDAIARSLAKQTGAKVVSAIHSTDPWRKRWHVWLDRATARHVDLFISNSWGGGESALRREKHPAEKIALCPQGIPDLPELSPAKREAIRREWGVAPGEVVACCVANFRWMKGHEDLIRAFHLLPADLPAKLVLAGDGPELPRVSRLAEELGLGDRVVFLGRVAEVAPVLRASDLFVLASRHEGLPTAILEAMAAGLPLLVTDWEGARESLSGTARFVKVGDHVSLAENLAPLLLNEIGRDKLGRKARERYEEEFRAEGARERMLALYREVLAEKG
jgi:glycosyltransferase involved in cell wall biosynthesis